MPDITMCGNVECRKKEQCYRYMANPNECYQSYALFKPIQTNGGFICASFWALKDADKPTSSINDLSP